MATQLINVIVNSKGAVTVQRELSKIGESAKQTSTYLNSMRAILAAALTFSGLSSIVEVVDNFTVLQNRLKQVADSANTVGESWSRLMDIANSSYSTIDNTVNLYFRVAQAYKAWGESAAAAYEFTDLFQKAAVLSGSSMQTTSQAVYQFSQALNKGKLDGDEFRSVLEGLPYVASLIQKSLGVTRAELYEMSKDGKISVDRIKQAFESAAATIRRDWSNITPTIGMALVVLKNNWTDFVGEIQTSTGLFSGIAYLILAIANNFELLAIAISPVAVALGFLAGRLGLGLVVLAFQDMYGALSRLIPALWSMNAALLANPYVLIGVAIAAIVAAIIYFRNELGLTDEVLAKLWTTATTAFQSILTYLSPIVTAIGEIIVAFLEWSGIFSAISALANVTMADISNMFVTIGEAVSQFVGYMRRELGPLFSDLLAMAKAFGGLVMEIVNIFVAFWKPAVIAVLNHLKELWNFIQPALRMFVSLLGDILKGWTNIANWLQKNFLPIVKDVFEGWIIVIRAVIDGINRIISALRSAINLMKTLTGMGGGGGGGGPGAHYGFQGYAGEFATGGSFKVGGTGAGRDTTPVAFRAERGERVTVETKKQQRANDNRGEPAPVIVKLNNVNVFDPSMMPSAMESHSGQRATINTITANRDEIISILGVA